MSGAVILVHMANPPAFYERRIYRNVDGKNLNRMYPGKADGTQTERIAFALTREVIDRATHLVDMHCGDGNEWLRPYSYWQVTGDAKMDAAGKELALAYGLDHIVIDRERPKDPAKSLYTANTAVLRGKPAITAEAGGMGATEEASVGAQEAGALSVIAHLGIQDLPSVKVDKPLFIDRSEVLTSPVTGVWRWSVEPMQSVAAGTLLGRVHDPRGNVLAEVRAPFAGEVLYVVATPPVSKGEPVAFIGQVTRASAVDLAAGPWPPSIFIIDRSQWVRFERISRSFHRRRAGPAGPGIPEPRARAHEAGLEQEGRERAVGDRLGIGGGPAQAVAPGAGRPAGQGEGQAAQDARALRFFRGHERPQLLLSAAEVRGEGAVHEDDVRARRPHGPGALSRRPGQGGSVGVGGIGGARTTPARAASASSPSDGSRKRTQSLEGARMGELRAAEPAHEVPAPDAPRLFEGAQHGIDRGEAARPAPRRPPRRG